MPTSTQTQLRRGTAAQVAAMTPVDGEPVYNTTDDRIHLGNGATAGGVPHPNSTDIQKQSFIYGTVGGTANAITLTNSPVVASYVNGLRLKFKATATNSGATTVNVDGLGTKNIYKLSGTTLGALTGNEIVSGAIYELNYDGTQFQLGSGGGGSVASVKRQKFTTSGTYTPNAGMIYCIAEAVGGGGGGGGATIGFSGGGGSGAYARQIFSAADIGASKTVTIGAAGTAGAPGTGGTGGTTSLGTLLVVTGGVGGTAAGAGSAGTLASGGAGGTVTTGDFGMAGQSGLPGFNISGTNSTGFSGAGGSSPYGPGAAGKNGTGVGNTATVYGAGGGGASYSSDGGAGSAGVIYITEYCSQ